MKFLSIALAALLGLTEGKRSITAKQLKTRMEKGQFNKQTLMRGAKPYSPAARKLEEAEEEEEWQINGLYSVQFNSCLSLTVQDDDLFDENFINYAQDGQIIAEKSYILFSVCYSSDCYYQAEDQKMTFITDVATYFQAFADFLPNQVESYCQGCEQNYDYCMGNLEAYQEEEAEEEQAEEEQAEEEQAEEGEEEAQEEEAEEEQAEEEAEGEEGEGEEGEGEEGEGERRKLSDVVQLPFRKLQNNKIVQTIDCDMCDAYDCFAEEVQYDDAQEVYEFEQALEWLNGLSECQEIENANNWNGDQVYAGLICNAEGNGVEIGVFYDQDCVMYSPSLSYSSMMSYADSQYFSMSEEVVEYMFTNDFSCYQPEIVYTNPYEYYEEEEQAEEEEYQAPEAAEWCGQLFNGQMEATDLYDCGVDADAEGDDAAEEEEYDENLYYYDWYSYELSQQQMEDSSEVCQVVKAMEGGYTTVYDKKNGGTLYNYKKQWGSNFNKGGGMGTGALILIVVLLVAAAAGVSAFLFKSKKPEDKKAPLINNADGTMA